MRVAVGSTNPSKVLAVKKAWILLGDAEVLGVKVSSGVREQPRSLKEVIIGARNRALNALNKINADYGVGIEAGFMEIPIYEEKVIDVQAAVIVDKEGYETIGFSPAFEVPSQALNYDTLGKYMAKVTGRAKINEEIGAIGYLSLGTITRMELTYYAVIMALIPRINKHLYTRLGGYA